MSLSLKDSKIVQKWSALLPNCAGEGPGLIKMVEDNLGSYEVPGLAWKQESAKTGFIKGMMGNRRDVLAIRNEQLSEWLVCIGAHDYGRFLSVVWYMTTSPKLMNKIRGVASGGLVGLAMGGTSVFVDDLDVFGQQDLSAYSGVTIGAVQDAVQELIEKRKLDLDRLNRKASGLFAVA